MAKKRSKRSKKGLPHYDARSPNFTLAIHYGGLVVGEGDRKDYMDGQVEIFDDVDSEKMSIPGIYELLRQCGVESDEEEDNLWWCVPTMSFGSGCRRLLEDKDVVAMMSYVPKHRFMRIYVEHIFELEPIAQVPPNSGEKEQHVPDSDEEDQTYTPGSDEEEEDDDNSEFVDFDYEVEDDENLAANFVNVEIGDDVLKGQPTPKETGKGKNVLEPDEDEVDSEYAASDELTGVQDSSDDEFSTKQRNFPTFNPEVDMDNPVFKLGMLFASMEEFKDAIKEYAIRNRLKISFHKNDLCRVIAICKGRSACPFLIYGRWNGSRQALQVRKLVSQHTCVKVDKIKWVTFKYLAKRFMSRIQADPNFTLDSFAEVCQREMGLQISRSKLSRARIEAKRLLHGEDKEQYSKLWDYGWEIKHQMPGSTVYIIPRMNLFDKMYICLDPCKRGFLGGCRPIIFLDGCHLKSPYGGQLLTAVGIDANDCIFPIAIAAVEVEDRMTWTWFLSTLKEDLCIENTSAWTLMIGRQKGLIAAVEDQFIGAEHRFCVRHMYQNFQAIFAGEGLKRNVWACARSSFPQEFEQNMEEIKRVSVTAWEWLSDIDPRQWSRAYFREFPKCDVLVNNISECFNKYILSARGKPMLEMLETMRCQLMKRLFDKSTYALKMRQQQKYCPKIIKKVNKNIGAGASCWATASGALQYQVKAQDGIFIVDIKGRTCSCRRWQLTGIPCCHAVAPIFTENMSPEDLIHDCYSVSMYSASYKYFIQPLRDPRQWMKTGCPEILPPAYTKKPGRPRKSRRKNTVEIAEGTKISQHGIAKRCTSCGNLGHNKRGCAYSKPGTAASQASNPDASASQASIPDASASTAFNPTQATSHAYSSIFVTRWTSEDPSHVMPTPSMRPPPDCAFLRANAPPGPSVPLTTSTKKERAAASKRAAARKK